MVGWLWSILVALDADIRAAEVEEETKEEYMDKAAVQAAVELEEEEEHKISHRSNISIHKSNRHNQRPKRDWHEAFSTVRATNTSASALS